MKRIFEIFVFDLLAALPCLCGSLYFSIQNEDHLHLFYDLPDGVVLAIMLTCCFAVLFTQALFNFFLGSGSYLFRKFRRSKPNQEA